MLYRMFCLALLSFFDQSADNVADVLLDLRFFRSEGNRGGGVR